MIFRLLFRMYKIFLSPFLGANCRFLPTCSEYADEALKKHGLAKGSILATKRICRCNPFGGSGIDNVPEK